MCYDPMWWYFKLIFLSEFYWKAQAVYMQGSNVRDRCCFFMKVLCLVAQSCLTLWDPIDFSLPGSSVHGILQAKILEWVAMPSFRGSSQPGIKARSPTFQADPNGWATREHFILGFRTPEANLPCFLSLLISKFIFLIHLFTEVATV